MNDLRHDPDESQAAPRDGTPTHRTPVELRTAEARLLDAAARHPDDDGEPRDTRTFPEMVVAELVRLVDTMQAFSLRQDVFEEELSARRSVVDARLVRLEDSLKRIADSVQIIALERDGKGKREGAA